MTDCSRGDMATSTSENQQLFSPTEMMAEAEKFALSKANKTSSMTLSFGNHGWRIHRACFFILYHGDHR